jgi:ABC-2 type transport system permease protein
MDKVLTIAYREFTYNLRRPAFLFAVFGTPLIIIVALVLSVALADSRPDLSEYGTVGYIDNSAAQVLAPGEPLERYPDLFVRYESKEAADEAARAGTLAAYFELPEDYLDNGQVILYTMQPAPDGLFGAIEGLLATNLAVGIPNEVAVDLLVNGPSFDVTAYDVNRTFDENGGFFVVFMPIIFGFLLIMSSVTTSSFLMSGLVEEKTNRIMEVLITSVKPSELLLGKLLGMGALGLLQIVLLLVAGVVGLSIAQQNNVLSGLTIPPDLVVLAIVYYLLSYFLLAAVSIAIGAVVGTEQESRQLSAFMVLPVMLPYILLVSFIIDPNGTVPTLLSLIPFTAPMAILMRTGMTNVPLWQIAVSIAGLVILNVIVMWAAARLFKWGVLSTSKMPGLGRILQALRGRAPEIAPQTRQTEAL